VLFDADARQGGLAGRDLHRRRNLCAITAAKDLHSSQQGERADASHEF
jgi:hypothetical protein